jgi:hypothetical protein
MIPSALPLGILFVCLIGALLLAIGAGVVASQAETPKALRREAAGACAFALAVAVIVGAVATHPSFHIWMVLK